MSAGALTDRLFALRKITTADHRKRHVPVEIARLPRSLIGTANAVGKAHSRGRVRVQTTISKDLHAFLKVRALLAGTSIDAEIAQLIADARKAHIAAKSSCSTAPGDAAVRHVPVPLLAPPITPARDRAAISRRKP